MPQAMVRKWVGHVDQYRLKHYIHITDVGTQVAMRRLMRAQDSSFQNPEKDDEQRGHGDKKGTNSAHLQHRAKIARNA